MHGHALGDAQPDRADLALLAQLVGAEPDAAAARDARGGHAEVGAGRDHRLLEAAYEVDDQHVLGQPDDRVGHDLAGAVEGDLAAAVDVDDRRAAAVDRSLVRLGALAGGVGRRVLEQQHRVGPLAGHDLGVHPALELPGIEVVDRVGAGAGDLEDQRFHV